MTRGGKHRVTEWICSRVDRVDVRGVSKKSIKSPIVMQVSDVEIHW